MNEQDQERIARWMDWKQDAQREEYWYTADDPEHKGESRRLPDLDIFEGHAVWVALIKAELRRRSLRYMVRASTGHTNVTVFNRDMHNIGYSDDTADELAALTAAVLAIMESEK